MKKLILTEAQTKKLMDKMVSEQFSGQERYSQEVSCSFDYHNLTYKGHKIEWIPDVRFIVSFVIHLETRKFGIKGITIGDIRGPEAIDIDVTYYPEGSNDPVDEEVMLQLNWDDVTIHDDADIGWIGIDQDIEIDLTITQDGGLAAGGVLVHSKDI